jgi:hypothetical protein
MHIRIFCCSFRLVLLVIAGSAFLFSQRQQLESDPHQAVSLAAQAMTALTNGVAPGDIALSGNGISTCSLPYFVIQWESSNRSLTPFEELQRGVQQ